MSDENCDHLFSQLMKRGVDAYAKDKSNKTLLHYACESSKVILIKYLTTKYCFDVNEPDSQGYSPFFYFIKTKLT